MQLLGASNCRELLPSKMHPIHPVRYRVLESRAWDSSVLWHSDSSSSFWLEKWPPVPGKFLFSIAGLIRGRKRLHHPPCSVFFLILVLPLRIEVLVGWAVNNCG